MIDHLDCLYSLKLSVIVLKKMFTLIAVKIVVDVRIGDVTTVYQNLI